MVSSLQETESVLADVSRAAQVVATLADSLRTPYHGASFMTKCVYDTAWVAMVSKPGMSEDGVPIHGWLFPECFQFLVDSQRQDGGFGEGTSDVDGILNTMAAILALCKLRKGFPAAKTTYLASYNDLELIIARGKQYLVYALNHWDVESAVHVGFEILTPKLLNLLQHQGIDFKFPGRSVLMALNRQKVNRIEQAVFYTPVQTTLLHSLEAFVGDVDMEKMRHHIRRGSMMASPSSTAAYLMGLRDWDHEAEAYLRFVVNSGKGRVPSAFPTTVFETTWAVTNLLEAGFTADELGSDNLKILGDSLAAELRNNGHVTGFAPGVLADADDTARAILCLRLLRYDVEYGGMIEKFETETHFKTFDLESNESFSANCNVLIALLSSKNPSAYLPQITKALGYLCQKWYNGACSDKWNLEPQYCIMLFAQGLLRTLELWNADVDFGDVSVEATLREYLPLITLQMLVRTLSSQKEDGSWNSCPEITAYALLTLRRLVDLPWCDSLGLGNYVRESISRGSEFLEQRPVIPAFVWVEKVTYGSSILAEAYCLAARRVNGSTAGVDVKNWGEKVRSLVQTALPASEKLEGFVRFFSRLPIFSGEPVWRIRASVAEGYMLLPRLRRSIEESAVFPPTTASAQSGRNASYLEYIPLTWTTSNNAADFGISTQTMCDMSMISVLNFQVDKYLEKITEDNRLLSLGSEGFEALRSAVRSLLKREHTDRDDSAHADQECGIAALLKETTETLSRFTTFVLGHQHISRTTEPARQRLERQLLVFLEAHIIHGEDSAQMRQDKATPSGAKLFTRARDNGYDYYDWVRTTSANHTSCPYSFDFFTGLISQASASGKRASNQGRAQDCFSSQPQARYLASDVCRHLATLCRQYNDYGSVRRDHAEDNLNSVDFPEFQVGNSVLEEVEGNGHIQAPKEAGQGPQQRTSKGVEERRAELMKIASYERECLDLAVTRLKPLIDERTAKALQVFIDVTDLYGQIYAVRDINA